MRARKPRIVAAHTPRIRMPRMQGLLVIGRAAWVKRRPRSLARDAGAEGLQARVDTLVSAVDLLDVADDRAAGRRECRGDQGHSSTNVGRDDRRAVKTPRSDTQRTMRTRGQAAGPQRPPAAR